MLKLIVRQVEICKISKVLGKNRLKSSVTDSTIIIDSNEITDDVVDKLFEYTTIVSAQNYQDNDDATSMDIEVRTEREEASTQIPLQVADSTKAIPETESVAIVAEARKAATITEPVNTGGVAETNIQVQMHVEETTKQPELEEVSVEKHADARTSLIAQKSDTADERLKDQIDQIRSSEMVYRGEVYQWGTIREYEDREGLIKECVIIIQNDYRMSASDDTIVLLCTSHYERRAPISYSFQLIPETMMEYSKKRLKQFDKTTLFVSHIKGVSRNEFGRYLGTMNNSFMNNLQPMIDFCLGLKRSRNVNQFQLQILSTINMADLFAILDTEVNCSEKITRILRLFNFDMSKKGMKYVRDAILIAYTKERKAYRLEDLAESIAKKEHVEAKEILRLIVARTKENFNFKKSPTISFIRMVVQFLRGGNLSNGFDDEDC